MMKDFVSTGEKWLYIISYVNISPGFYWFFKELSARNIKVTVIFMHWVVPEIQQQVEALGHTTYYVNYAGKKDIIKTFFKVFSLIRKIRPALVHTHLFDASLIGIPAAGIAGVKKRIHTRHHASQHHVYSPGTVRYDRLINYFSTTIIAVSSGIKKLLVEKEQVDPKKIRVIYHGFDSSYFYSAAADDVEILRKKYNAAARSPVIGVISRYTHWKGIQFIISAFKKLLDEYPDALLILANAGGDYENAIHDQLKSLPADRYIEIKFESQMPALYRLFDVFVHVPVDAESEAFGQVYIEALAAARPAVFTLSGIAAEFVKDNVNAMVVPFKNPDAIFQKMQFLIRNPAEARRIAINGQQEVEASFGIGVMVDKTLDAYA